MNRVSSPGGVVAQMEAGTLLAYHWSWSLKVKAKGVGPCAGGMEVSVRE